MNQLLDRVGQEEHLYEMFVNATEEVFHSVLNAVNQGARDESFLIDFFNDDYESKAVICHLRVSSIPPTYNHEADPLQSVTSAWMTLNPQSYQAFLSMPLDQYCSARINPVETEIDEVGLQALVDGVIGGSGLGVEILYLDRSAGDSVTPHLLTPTQSSATIRLLYRP